MSVTLSADKMLQIMDIMRRNPRSLRPVASTKQQDQTPVRMRALVDHVLSHKIPLTYTITIGEQDYRLHLLEGYADTESPGAPIIAPYNAVLKALGNKAVLDEHAPYSEVCRAHRVIYNRVVGGVMDVPEATSIREDAEEAKPVDTTTNTTTKKAPKEPLSRPYVWVKNGVETRITAKQWEQRVRMCGGLDRVPVGCGEVGDPFDLVVLAEHAEPEVEWDNDIPYVVEVEPGDERLVQIVQRPTPEAKAKRQAAKQREATIEAEVTAKPSLAEALAILTG